MKNMCRAERLSLVRQRIRALNQGCPEVCHSKQTPGLLSGVFKQEAIHELYAANPADAVAVNAFALAVGMLSANGQHVVWALDATMTSEHGTPYVVGIEEMGIDSSKILLVKAPNIKSLLIVGEESLKSPPFGSVVISAWGNSKALSLNSSRRLALAAKLGGATLFCVRAGAEPSPSAAETRWSVKATASTSLAGGAPGHPSFSLTLLRRRGGGEVKNWILEWDRDARSFREPAPLSGAMVPVAAQRPAEAWGDSGRRVA
ncbi:hypothetical protein [Brevundimonas sp. MEB006b]|uniref:ImuA family protein n=1 Tax=Brevundimonas sp. MEB006b TaxID=3040283 RepID=UPI00254C459D|nr:hypothetical protein [Brevundimonas sp. MEB006b]